MNLEYTVHITFDHQGIPVNLKLCSIALEIITLDLTQDISEHLKVNLGKVFAIRHRLLNFYRNEIRGCGNWDVEIGAVNKETFEYLKSLWPCVTRLPDVNPGKAFVKMAAMRTTKQDCVVYLSFERNMPAALHICQTKAPNEVATLKLNSLDSIDEHVKNFLGQSFQIRHRIINLYKDDWNVGTTDKNTFHYLKRLWPKVNLLEPLDAGKAMVTFAAIEHKPEIWV